jgi:hypothetical protein
VLAAILADLRARAHSAAGQAGPDDPGPSAVAHYEDAP